MELGTNTRGGFAAVRTFGAIAALALLGFGSIHGFYQDDLTWLSEAIRAVRDPSHLMEPWRDGFVRPLAQIAFFLEFRMFGLHSVLFNVFGLLIHLVNTWLSYRVLHTCSVDRSLALFGAVLFLAGAGHANKAVVWSCSHSLLFGTACVLGGTLLALHSDRPMLRCSLAFGLLLVAAGFHEMLVPALLGVPILAYPRVPDRVRRAFLFAGAAGFLGYLVLTRTRHGVFLEHSDPDLAWQVVRNGFHFLLTFLGPFHRRDWLARLLGGDGLLTGVAVAAAGATVAGVWLWGLRRAPRRMWLVAGCGILLVAPATLVELAITGTWGVDVRYLYPAAALLCGVLARPLTRLAVDRPRLAQVLALALMLSTLVGSGFRQVAAVREGRSEASQRRLEALRKLRAAEVSTRTADQGDPMWTAELRCLPSDMGRDRYGITPTPIGDPMPSDAAVAILNSPISESRR